MRNANISISHKWNKGNKGNIILSMILLIVVLVAFGFISILGYQAFTEAKTDIYPEMTSNESRQVLDDTQNRYPSVIDGLIMFIFIGLWVAGIVSAMVSSNHPILFFFMFIGVIFVIVAGLFLANFYEEFMEDPDLTSLAATFPATNWLLTHLLTIGIVMGISMAITYFAASRSGG